MSELALLSVEELQNLIKEAKLQIAKRQQANIKNAYLQMLQIASSVDMSIEEVLQVGRSFSGKPKQGNTVPPKYANPANPAESWTGRGKKPRWVTALQTQGVSLESLRITT